MPDYLSEANSGVAKLLYHCGVAMNMDYGSSTPKSNGSSASDEDAENALNKYFLYKSAKYVARKNYSTSEWVNLLTNELRNGRPLIYSGERDKGEEGKVGHAWVCDGYEKKLGAYYFSMNWGWGGWEDGYFLLSEIDYDLGQGCIFNIIPDECPANKKISSPVSFPWSIEASNSISVSVKVKLEENATVLDAGSYIRFLPGALIETGTTILARIEGCGGIDPSDGDFSNAHTAMATLDDVEEKLSLDAGVKSSSGLLQLSSYPNPFSTSTMLQFGIKEEKTKADLSIWDVHGKLMQNLTPVFEQTSGNHQVHFDGSHLPAGVYFVRLVSGSVSQTIRLVKSR